MKLTQIASLAVLASVPAIVTSCGPNYSTPEGQVEGMLQLLEGFAADADACKDGDVDAMEKVIDRYAEKANKMAEARKEMTADQKSEMRKLAMSEKYKERRGKAAADFGKALLGMSKKAGIMGTVRIAARLTKLKDAMDGVL